MTSNRTVIKKGQKKSWDQYKRRRKWLFLSRQVTFVQIAEEMGLSPETVKTVVNHFPKRKSRRIQEYIAQRFGVSYERLWGFFDHHSPIVAKGKKVVND